MDHTEVRSLVCVMAAKSPPSSGPRYQGWAGLPARAELVVERVCPRIRDALAVPLRYGPPSHCQPKPPAMSKRSKDSNGWLTMAALPNAKDQGRNRVRWLSSKRPE